MTKHEIAAAAALYRQGRTLADIGKRYGVSRQFVWRCLVRLGVTMRARGGKRRSRGG